MEPPNERADAPNAVVGEENKSEKAGKGFVVPLVLFLVALLGGGGGAFLMYDKIVAFATGTDLTAADQNTAKVEYGVFHEMSGLIVNPAESEGKRYLMVSMGLEVESEAVIAKIEDREIVIRDQVLEILGSHTADELADIATRERLKGELLTSVNDALGDKSITRLYFTQYVLQ